MLNVNKQTNYNENGVPVVCVCVVLRPPAPGGVSGAYGSAITFKLSQLLYYVGSAFDLHRQPAALHHHNGSSDCVLKRGKAARLSAVAGFTAFIASTCIMQNNSSLMQRLRFKFVLLHASRTGERKLLSELYFLTRTTCRSKMCPSVPCPVCHTSCSFKEPDVVFTHDSPGLGSHKHKETKSLSADASSGRFFSPSHSSLSEWLRQCVKACIPQTIRASPGERSASCTLCCLFSLLIMAATAGSSCRAVNTSPRPSSHRLKSFSLEIHRLFV